MNILLFFAVFIYVMFKFNQIKNINKFKNIKIDSTCWDHALYRSWNRPRGLLKKLRAGIKSYDINLLKENIYSILRMSYCVCFNEVKTNYEIACKFYMQLIYDVYNRDIFNLSIFYFHIQLINQVLLSVQKLFLRLQEIQVTWIKYRNHMI